MYHNGEKQVINNSEREYQTQLKAAKAMEARSAGNQYINGVQDFVNEGLGNSLKKDRTATGNTNLVLGELVRGPEGGFSVKDEPGNMPMKGTTTGSLASQTSSTANPQEDPENLDARKLDDRLRMYAQAAGNAGMNLNGPNRRM